MSIVFWRAHSQATSRPGPPPVDSVGAWSDEAQALVAEPTRRFLRTWAWLPVRRSHREEVTDCADAGETG